MAAGAPQPDTVPSVEDLAVCGTEEQDSGDWATIGSEAGLITVQDPTAADDPGGMLATAPEGPAALHAVAAVDNNGIPERPKRSGRSNVQIAPVYFLRRIRRQVPAERAIFAGDRHAPAGRAIGSRNLFDDPNQRHRIGFFAAQRARYPESE
jgi:hypothetical protein